MRDSFKGCAENKLSITAMAEFDYLTQPAAELTVTSRVWAKFLSPKDEW